MSLTVEKKRLLKAASDVLLGSYFPMQQAVLLHFHIVTISESSNVTLKGVLSQKKYIAILANWAENIQFLTIKIQNWNILCNHSNLHGKFILFLKSFEVCQKKYIAIIAKWAENTRFLTKKITQLKYSM